MIFWLAGGVSHTIIAMRTGYIALVGKTLPDGSKAYKFESHEDLDSLNNAMKGATPVHEPTEIEKTVISAMEDVIKTTNKNEKRIILIIKIFNFSRNGRIRHHSVLCLLIH